MQLPTIKKAPRRVGVIRQSCEGEPYLPRGNQLRAHLFRRYDPGAKEILILAPIRSGKSFWMKHEITADAWNNKTKGATLVAAPTYRMLGAILEEPLVEYWQRIGILGPKAYNKTDKRATLKNGNKVFFRSLEKPDSIRGLTIGPAYIDETAYCSEYSIDVVRGRQLTTGGRLIMATTPKGTANHVYENYFSEQGLSKRPSGFRLVRFSMLDNPCILPADIEVLRGKYDPRLAAQELDAEFVNLFADSVYHQFDDKGNVAEVSYRRGSNIYIGLDYNVGIMAYVVIQRLGNGMFAVIDEGYGSHDVQAVAANIIARYGKDVYIIDDVSGRSRNQGDGKTNRQILAQSGLRQIHSSKKNPLVVRRVSLVNAYLLNGQLQRRILIHPRCRRLISELRVLSYKEGTGTIDSLKNKRGHITDALGYAITYLTGGSAGWDVKAPSNRSIITGRAA